MSTETIRQLREENERLRSALREAQEVVYWIENMPSIDAIREGALTERNQVHCTPEVLWGDLNDDTRRHWFDHVGPAIRAAFAEELRLAAPPFHPLQKLKAALVAAVDDQREHDG